MTIKEKLLLRDAMEMDLDEVLVYMGACSDFRKLFYRVSQPNAPFRYLLQFSDEVVNYTDMSLETFHTNVSAKVFSYLRGPDPDQLRLLTWTLILEQYPDLFDYDESLLILDCIENATFRPISSIIGPAANGNTVILWKARILGELILPRAFPLSYAMDVLFQIAKNPTRDEDDHLQDYLELTYQLFTQIEERKLSYGD